MFASEQLGKEKALHYDINDDNYYMKVSSYYLYFPQNNFKKQKYCAFKLVKTDARWTTVNVKKSEQGIYGRKSITKTLARWFKILGILSAQKHTGFAIWGKYTNILLDILGKCQKGIYRLNLHYFKQVLSK